MNLATDVFLSKYSLKGEESPNEMHDRLAKEFARVLWSEYGLYRTYFSPY